MRILFGIGSKAKRLFLSSSAKEKSANGENQVVDFGLKSNPVVDSGFSYMGSDFGSKDESFFDSRAWLDSDCEDDFYSVNGDFTPSRGGTPNYQLSAPGTPQWKKPLSLPQIPDTKSEPSPTAGKKKLSDLLLEPFQGEHLDHEKIAESNGKKDGFGFKNGLPPRSSEGTPCISKTNSELSSEMTPGTDFSHRKERAGKTKSCCFPSLMPSRSLSYGRKQMLSPAH